MDHLFTPWRFDYVTGKKTEQGCVFCNIARSDPGTDHETYVVWRAEHHYVVLNIYPYTSGHLLIVPFEHRQRLSELTGPALAELAELAARVEKLLMETYGAQGLNFGLNLGRCAGAGIEEHLHLHAVPRWGGDTNFMTVTGQTRVIPDGLADSWTKLRERLGVVSDG